MTGFAEGWDPELAAELAPQWMARQYMSGALIEAEELVAVVDSLVRGGATLSMQSVTVAPRAVVSPA